MQDVNMQPLNKINLAIGNRDEFAGTDGGESSDVGQRAPLRFWDVPHFLPCPIIGTCLDLTEARQILKKAGYPVKKMSSIQIHEALVSSSDDQNKLSRKIDARLNQKFKGEVRRFFPLPEPEIRKAWNTHMEDGEIEGLLWVVAIRPDLPDDFKRTIYGDVHMQMHLNASCIRNEMKKAEKVQKENGRLAGKVQELNTAKKELLRENKVRKNEREDTQRALAACKSRKAKLEAELDRLRSSDILNKLERENHALQSENTELATELSDSKKRQRFLEDQLKEAFAKLTEEEQLSSQLRYEVEKVINLIPTLNSNERGCPSFDLCQKRILVVGGITKLAAFYRKLIEKKGGVFEYHDGYLQNSSDELASLVKRADVVFCPVDCNSHGACLMVKRLSKRHNKPLKMLAKSSLNAVSQALMEYQENIKQSN